MKKVYKDRRKYLRYDTKMEVYFHVKYDIKTRLKFRVIKDGMEMPDTRRHSGLCTNVSAEGMGFSSKKKLGRGDILLIEVYEPIVKRPVKMEGEVRWSRRILPAAGRTARFCTGVRLISVGNKKVSDSIYFDEKYKVVWSAVLESLFGNFAAMVRKIKNRA
jgi:hypothetical protein